MFIKNYLFFILLTLLLVGCTSEDTNELKQEVKRLTVENTQLKDSKNKLETEVENFKEANTGLENEINTLKDLIEEYEDVSFNVDFNIYDEGFYIEPVLMFREDLTLEQTKNIMGKPNNVRSYIEEAHCGCEETEVNYDNASFTFQDELIKWMTLKDETFVTQRGIKVGSTKEQVIDSYGENFYPIEDGSNHEDNSINYGEKTGIRFSFAENVVSEITIWYMYE
ncbi:hypothetical protein GCM10011351_29320 [Paraliobacillus quinghaiensis]|uniref:Uncharacterized protein n=1 Tax=Paraliobacillus quinghaiensis TaxID=470815 RepID=A0A917TWL2_9BACI|nr:bZIP transcription factor [Paraliobacillus quinghaiensis]GGM41264.1 hypothetical protein GCM10011351_29320 [Paraliobacillus quinghaiensis]